MEFNSLNTGIEFLASWNRPVTSPPPASPEAPHLAVIPNLFLRQYNMLLLQTRKPLFSAQDSRSRR